MDPAILEHLVNIGIGGVTLVILWFLWQEYKRQNNRLYDVLMMLARLEQNQQDMLATAAEDGSTKSRDSSAQK